MNSKIKDSFLLLLKMGLWDKNYNHYPNFPLTNEEWSLIYRISISQTVEGLVYEGILHLPKEYFPPNDILFRWTARIDTIERVNNRMRKTLAALAVGFKKHNIDFLLLKGLGFAANYAKPNMRVSGDIDLYFKSIADYDAANKLVATNGCQVNKGDHHSVAYLFNKTDIEHHTKMIDIFNPFAQRYIKKLIEREDKHTQAIEFEGEIVTLPSHLINQVQANAHILKHYLGFGIGLRQLCDVARLCYNDGKMIDVSELKVIYKKLGISKWMNALHNLLVKDLGLPPAYLPYPIEKDYDTRLVLQDILNSGNFGFHDIRFNKNNADISKRENKRNNYLKRILPHTYRLIGMAPYEVIWYPINKFYTKITGN